MAQGLNSTKSAALPSHEALETHNDVTEVGKSEQHKLDHIAMESAKRAGNRIKADTGVVPGTTIFTK